MNTGSQPGTPSPPTEKKLENLGVFFARFIGVSILLYLLYTWAGFVYMRVVAYGAQPLLAIFGKKLIMKTALDITEEISLNPAVFLSLVIALTGVTWKKRAKAAIIGVLILTAANILTVFLSFMSFYLRNEKLWDSTEFFNLTINFFLPILLWLILMPVGNLLPVNPSSDAARQDDPR